MHCLGDAYNLNFTSMKKNLLICVSFILFSCIACDSRHIALIAEDISIAETDTITYELVPIDFMGSNDILAYDSLLFTVCSNPDGQLSVFSTNSKKLIKGLCKKGRAKGEFNQPFSPTKQIIKKDNSILIPLVNNGIQLSVVNVTESLRKGNTIIDSFEDCPFISDANVFICPSPDERIIAWNSRADDPFNGPFHTPMIEYKKNDKVIKKIKLFPKLVDSESDDMTVELYDCRTRMKPTGEYLVQTFYRMGYMFIVNYKTGEAKAVHIEGTPTFDDYFTKNNLPGRYFGDVAVTEDAIVTVYLGGGSLMERPKLQFLVFDWDGNLLSSIRIKEGIDVHSIAIDGKGGVIYAADIMNDICYSFNIKDIIH